MPSNTAFIKGAFARAETFIKLAILPELVARYTRKPVVICTHTNDIEVNNGDADDSDELWCYCRQPEAIDDMIRCDNYGIFLCD